MLVGIDDSILKRKTEKIYNRKILVPEDLTGQLHLKRYISNNIDKNFKIEDTHNQSFISYLV